MGEPRSDPAAIADNRGPRFRFIDSGGSAAEQTRRLYFREALSVADDFLELDLGQFFGVPGLRTRPAGQISGCFSGQHGPASARL
jgi:hypothetical protein